MCIFSKDFSKFNFWLIFQQLYYLMDMQTKRNALQLSQKPSNANIVLNLCIKFLQLILCLVTFM